MGLHSSTPSHSDNAVTKGKAKLFHKASDVLWKSRRHFWCAYRDAFTGPEAKPDMFFCTLLCLLCQEGTERRFSASGPLAWQHMKIQSPLTNTIDNLYECGVWRLPSLPFDHTYHLALIFLSNTEFCFNESSLTSRVMKMANVNKSATYSFPLKEKNLTNCISCDCVAAKLGQLQSYDFLCHSFEHATWFKKHLDWSSMSTRSQDLF